ncbi:MAG: hypothetical protein ACLFRD_10815 [Nitriliruptoraceae bacterium]
MTWRPPEPDPYLELADDARLRDAVAARSEQRRRRDLAAELATWTGTLRDLAERAVPVVVGLAGAAPHRAVIAAVGLDHLALRLHAGGVVLVALEVVRTVRPEPGQAAPVATGDRERSQDRTLVEALARAAESRQRIAVAIRDVDDPVTGQLVGLGEDVLTLRADGEDQPTIYAPTDTIREVLLDP